MQGRSSYIGKGVVACLAILGGAGLGGLAAGLNARFAVSPQPSPAVMATTAEMAPSETVNLRFPADWSDAAAEAAPQVVKAAMASAQKGDAAPRRMVLASADSGMVLLSPRPTYPVTAEVPDTAEPPAKRKPAPQQAAYFQDHYARENGTAAIALRHVANLAIAARKGIEPAPSLAHEALEVAQWASQSSAAAAIQHMSTRLASHPRTRGGAQPGPVFAAPDGDRSLSAGRVYFGNAQMGQKLGTKEKPSEADFNAADAALADAKPLTAGE